MARGSVDSMGDLSASQRRAFEPASRFLEHLEVTPMKKSYKMLVLRSMLDLDRLPGEITIDELSRGFERIAGTSAIFRADIGAALDDPAALRRHIESNPIAA